MATKKHTAGLNTGMFYALISQLPGYDARFRDLIKEGAIDDFLTNRYGERHGRELRLSKLSAAEYRELIRDLKVRVNESKDAESLQKEAVRKRLVHQILAALSRIHVIVINGDYDEVNYHITRLPISRGRTIPGIPTDELPGLLGAVRAYCGVIKKRQQVEKREPGKADTERLISLETRYKKLLEQLCRNPSDEDLSRLVRHIEIDIVRLTGEKNLDY